MANLSSSVPYNDPHDTMFTDDVSNFMSMQNPTLEDLTIHDMSISYPSSVPQSRDQIDDIIDISDDGTDSDFLNDPNAEDSGTENSNNVNSRPLSVCPNAPLLYPCSWCRVLREIVHFNGIDITRLEIHGSLGQISHAVLNDQSGSTNAVTPGYQYQMFDFSEKSMEDVKQFLLQHCLERNLAGYIMVKNPQSLFYQVLCTGFDWDDNLNNGDSTLPSSLDSGTLQIEQAGGGMQMDESAGNGKNQRKNPRPSMAIQRERTRNVSLRELENHFHLPIQQAANKMEFSATVLKKLCRKHGVQRWPRRKIQSVEKKINNWASRLTSIKDPAERALAEKEIQNLQREIAKFCDGSNF
ncbi:hypothetical protein DITRI_Ditri07aG0154300 [Diplodiscus trichospermus]